MAQVEVTNALSPTDAALLWCSDETYDAARDIGVIADIPPSIAAWPVVPADWPADSRERQCDSKDGYLDLETVLIVATKRMRQSNHQIRVYCCVFGLHYHLTSAPKYELNRNPLRTEEPKMTTTVIDEAQIKIGDIWTSIRDKHLNKHVKILSVSNRAVNVVVVKSGSNQNRRTRGKPEHIGKEVFLAHYTKLHADRIPQPLPPLTFPQPEQPIEPMTTTLELPVQDVPVQPVESASYDFTEFVRRAEAALERMGGRPVKTYVLTQYFSGGLRRVNNEYFQGLMTSSDLTDMIVNHGVKMGVLESWPGDRSNKRMTGTWVGLPGRDRTPILPNGAYPGVGGQKHTPRTSHIHTEATMTTTTFDQAAKISENIKTTYAALSPEKRLSIATDAETLNHQQLQKKYHLMGPVIVLVKQEFGIPVKSHNKTTRVPKAATTSGTASEPTASEPTPEAPANGAWRELVTPRVRVTRTEKVGRGRLVYDGPARHAAPVPDYVPAEAANEAFEAEVTRFVESGAPLETYQVTVLVLQPSEVTLTFQAPSMEAALAMARGSDAAHSGNLTEIVGVTKVR